MMKIFVGYPQGKWMQPPDLPLDFPWVTIKHKNQLYLGYYFAQDCMGLGPLKEAIVKLCSQLQNLTVSAIEPHRALIVSELFF